MKPFVDLSVEELNRLDSHALVTIIVSLQTQLKDMSSQLNAISEQLAIMNQRTYGRKTEKVDPNQLSFLDMLEVYNEAESLSDDSPEPLYEEIVVSGYTKKKKTTKEQKLEGLPARIIEHKLSEEELAEAFPNGYKELPIKTVKHVAVIPQQFIVDEHHIHVYASKDNDGTIISAANPDTVFRNSIVTPSLLALILNNKFEKHLPLDRQSKMILQDGLDIGSNTLANWVIRSSEDYFSKIWNELHHILIEESTVLHADETPFEIVRDGRPAGSESRMWVYRNGNCNPKHPITLFEAKLTRGHEHPKEFLKGFSGVLVTDGYQAYHALAKENSNIKVAGCWVHAKRKFSDIVKSNKKEEIDDTIAEEAIKRISYIMHLDNQLDDLTKAERLKRRKLEIKPQVNAFFSWVKSVVKDLPDNETRKSLNYCINQEEFLRLFLTNADIPMDNNRAEQAIRPFTLGRKNWVIVDSIKGADASATLYSLVETAKANGLLPYAYFEYLLEEMIKHKNDDDQSYIQDLLPWNEKVQEKCKMIKKSKKS